jgi:uncharacterized metal-binding protein YceD (DUF177 family)
LSDAGADITLSPSDAERAAIAHWLGIEAIGQLQAIIRLSRVRDDEYAYVASFEADVVQACVVTLEPVPSHLAGEFSRLFKVMGRRGGGHRRRSAEAGGSVEISHLEDDEPELIEGTSIDLAVPLLEEMSLALDPYPRAPGVAFEAPKEEMSVSDSPFAVLEALKTGSGSEPSSGQGKKRR